jgi:hypothetical protein
MRPAMPKPTAFQLAAFEGQPWWPAEFRRPAPAPEPPPEPPVVVELAPPPPRRAEPDAVALATRLLRQLAENPYVTSSVRVMARRHFKQLEKLRAKVAAEGLEWPDDGELEDDEDEGDWAA